MKKLLVSSILAALACFALACFAHATPIQVVTRAPPDCAAVSCTAKAEVSVAVSADTRVRVQIVSSTGSDAGDARVVALIEQALDGAAVLAKEGGPVRYASIPVNVEFTRACLAVLSNLERKIYDPAVLCVSPLTSRTW